MVKFFSSLGRIQIIGASIAYLQIIVIITLWSVVVYILHIKYRMLTEHVKKNSDVSHPIYTVCYSEVSPH